MLPSLCAYVSAGPLPRIQGLIRTFHQSKLDFAVDVETLASFLEWEDFQEERWKLQRIVNAFSPSPRIQLANPTVILLFLCAFADATIEVECVGSIK